MKMHNPFDKKLEAWKDRIPTEIRDAAVFVTDMLELCVASAQSVFDDKATPELALGIYDRIVAQMAGRNADPAES
ncbi:MAG: hypothetical protein WB676_24655 [Bryobacteraceae bacterium]